MSRRPERKLRTLTLLLIAVIAFPALAGIAAAEGGKSIGSGPLVVYGQQEFGSTAQGVRFGEDPHGWNQFWNLSVMTGDELTIDWEAGDRTRLFLYPAGTTDYTIGQQEPATHQGQNELGKNQLRYTVPATGVMPLVVNTWGQSGATYNFIAYVRHALAVFLPRFSTLRHRKTLRVQAHTPDGGIVNDPALNIAVEVKPRQGRWKTIGSAPVLSSVATIQVKVPKRLWHRRVQVRATASGGAYLATRSRVFRVFVP